MSGDAIGLLLVLGGAVVALALCTLGIARLRSALAEVVVDEAILPYQLPDLDPGARLARDQLVRRYVRRGLRGYLIIVLGLLAWFTGLSVLASGVLWWQSSTWGLETGVPAPLRWLPYAPALAVVSGFGLLLYLLAHDAQRRPKLRVARCMRCLLPWSSSGYLDPDLTGERDLLTRSKLARSRATQQTARDQVADLAHALLPQARRMADEDLRRTVGTAVAFAPRQSGQQLDTDRFADLLRLFDALFDRLRDDTGHQDIWRIAILRQLIRYTGPEVLPRIFGEIQGDPDGVDIEGLSLLFGRQRAEADEVTASVLDTAFGRGIPEEEAEGLGLIVDLTRSQRESASEAGYHDE
ncbi:hypothetical protein KIH74_24715 [Kineosporia sp. J2-2]|uniref:Uncharacterized protein n=1 Tax=Kineosporia corallincola TaxID=2835133 RepID=A0ABS5TM40_9ACTN|nr:hypothetical protein [Kineosporia corallincola]MBT0772170.1 hypothetical protein [Kineosporia corallincola]